MAELIKNGFVSSLKPEIQYKNDVMQVMGHCWVKGNELECYDWEDETMLIILDKYPASNDYIPEDSYYCLNPYKGDSGWVMAHQITFKLKSLLGEEPWKLPVV